MTTSPYDDLAILAALIQNSIKGFVQQYPEGRYEDAVEFALGKVMKATRGSMNLAVAKTIVQLERAAFKGSKYMLPC